MRAGIALLALSVALLSLFGCSPESEPPAPASSPAAPRATDVPATAVASPSPEPQRALVTLKLWVPEALDPYNRDVSHGYLLRQVASFSAAYPDVNVEVVVKAVHGRGGMLDFLRTAPDVAPSVMPDLMVIATDDLDVASSAELIQPLDDLLSPSVANDRFPFATEMGRIGDQTMGFVLGVKAQHQAYRADSFGAPPLTWTDVVSAPLPFVFAAGGREGIVNDATLIQYLSSGGSVTDSEGNPGLDRRAMVQAFSFYSRCIVAGVISPTQVLDVTSGAGSWDQFVATGSGLAIIDAGTYSREAGEATAAASAPTRDGDPFSIARGWVVTMVADEPSRQAVAMLLFDWLTGSEQNAAWTRAEGYLPGTRSAVMFWDASEGERVALSQLLEATVPAPPFDVMTVIGPAMQRGLEALLGGSASPTQAAAIAVAAVSE